MLHPGAYNKEHNLSLCHLYLHAQTLDSSPQQFSSNGIRVAKVSLKDDAY